MKYSELEPMLREMEADFKQRRGYDWPNCSVPDCDAKACVRLKSDKCYPHSTGGMPQSMDKYYGIED